MTKTELIRKESIEELIGHRDRALECYRKAAELILAGNKAAKLAAPSSHGVGLGRGDFDYLCYLDDNKEPSAFAKLCREKVDRDVWRSLLRATGLGSLMDREAQEEFEKGLEKEPPHATVETVCATFFQKAAESHLIFQRGLVNAFKRLAPGYKTNSPFRIGEKVIFDYGVDVWIWHDKGKRHINPRFSGHGTTGSELADIERVFLILDGKPPLENRYAGICGVIDAACQRNEWSAENDMFAAKWHQKRSLHVTFKRPDLVRKANQIIAEFFGEVLPDEDSRHRYPGSKKRPKRAAPGE